MNSHTTATEIIRQPSPRRPYVEASPDLSLSPPPAAYISNSGIELLPLPPDDNLERDRTPSPTPSEAAALAQEGFWSWRVVQTKEWWKRRGWFYVVILAGSAVFAALTAVYRDNIVNGLFPVSNFLLHTQGGWAAPVGILFILSFPPLFGHEIIATVIGLVWGIWFGWGIVILGTFLGEVANYYVFKYWCQTRARKHEKKNIFYGCFTRVIIDGGFYIALMARISIIPPHLTTTVFATCGMSIGTFCASALLSMPRQIIPVLLGTLLIDSPEHKQDARAKGISAGAITALFIATLFSMHVIMKRMRAVKPDVIYQRRKQRQQKREQAQHSSVTRQTSINNEERTA